MNEILAISVIGLLFILRFALPLVLTIGFCNCLTRIADHWHGADAA